MKRFVMFVLTALMLMTIPSCSQGDSQGDSGMAGLGHPSDYFPTAIGTTWEYEITVTQNKAVNYKEVIWPLGNGKAQVTAVRGFFMGQLSDKEKTKFRLSYRITGKPAQQAVFQYENARQLEVIEDELGIFDDVKELFWIITPGNEYRVSEVRTFDPNSSGSPRNSWGGWNQEDGYAHRLFMFGASPGTSIGISDSPDKLLFLDLEEGVLHFRREVDGREDDDSDLSRSFQEVMWFAKGKGLTKLVQYVGGKVTMTWELKSIN